MQCHTKFKSSERNFTPYTSFFLFLVCRPSDWLVLNLLCKFLWWRFVFTKTNGVGNENENILLNPSFCKRNRNKFLNGIGINFSYKICSNENGVCVICLLPFHEKCFGFPIETNNNNSNKGMSIFCIPLEQGHDKIYVNYN